MKNKYSDDLRLLKKARHRVNAMLIVSYVFLCVWPGAVYFLLGQPLFSRPDNFHVLYLVSMLVEMVLWMLIFFAISGGQPKTRWLVPAGITAEFAFCVWLVWQAFRQPQFLFVYIVWIILELVKNFYLLWLNGWMKNSWWARIYFDKVVAIPESEREAEEERQKAIARQKRQAHAPKQAASRQAPAPSRQMPQQPSGYVQKQPGQPYPNQNGMAQSGWMTGTPVSNPSGYPQQAWQPSGYPNANGYAPGAQIPQNSYPSQPAAHPYNNGHMAGSFSQGKPAGQNNSWPANQPVPNQQALPAMQNWQTPDFQNASRPGQNPAAGQNSAPSSFGFHPDIQSRQGHRAAGDQVRIPVKAPVDIAGNPHEEAMRRREQEKENRRKLSSRYPRMAIRIAIVVYGELMLFPTLVHIFQNNFVSIDNKSIFAVNLMFTLCILTAVLWTLPVFFLYLKQPGCKKMVWAAGIGQVLIAAFGGWMLSRYGSSETVIYSAKVFTLFLILEVIRYGILVVGVAPAFKLPEIHDSHSGKDIGDEDEEDEMAGYEFELIDEDDPDVQPDGQADDSGEYEDEDSSSPLDEMKDKLTGWLHR